MVFAGSFKDLTPESGDLSGVSTLNLHQKDLLRDLSGVKEIFLV